MVKDFAYLGELGKQRLYLLAATSLTAAADLTTATFEGPRITESCVYLAYTSRRLSQETEPRKQTAATMRLGINAN